MPLVMPPENLCDLDPNGKVEVSGALTISTDHEYVESLCINDGGVLTVANGKYLTVGTLHAMDGSTVIAGPTGGIYIRGDAPYDAIEDQFSTGLLFEGVVNIAGDPKTSWTRATQELAVNATSVTVEDVTGWNVDDEIVLVDSRQLTSEPHNPEKVTITSISSLTVHFTPALTHAYPAARGAWPSFPIEYYTAIGNITRSFVIKSLSPNSYNRGHSMACGNATGYIKNVAFVDMGRTTTFPLNLTNNIKGRYASHLHFLTNNASFELSGNAIVRSTPSKWAITLHSSHGQTIKNNVMYLSDGSGFMQELDVETANVIEDNLSIGVTNLSGFITPGNQGVTPIEGGISGHGFWFNGVDNYVRGNVSGNSIADGFFVTLLTTASIQYIREFDNNECIGCGNGLTLWYVGSLSRISVVSDFKEWHSVSTGNFSYPTFNVHFTGWYGRGDPNGLGDYAYRFGFHFGDYSTIGGVFSGGSIMHKAIAMEVPNGPSGGGGSDPRHFELSDTEFNNNLVAVYQTNFVGAGIPTDLPDLSNVCRNCLFVNNVKDFKREIRYNGAACSVINPTTLFVYDYNQVPGDNFRVYAVESARDYVIPAGPWEGGSGPYVGMTNLDAFAAYGVAINGEVAPPDAVPDSKVIGLIDTGIVADEGTLTTSISFATSFVGDSSGGAGNVSATFIGEDISTQGAWKGVYGLTAVELYEEAQNMPEEFTRGHGSMSASGQSPDYGGELSFDQRFPEHLTTINSGSTVTDPVTGVSVANGQPWGTYNGITARFGNQFYNRILGAGDNEVIAFHPQAIRYGIHIAGNACVRFYMVDPNNGVGHGPRVIQFDVYEMTNVQYTDPSGFGGSGQPYLPGNLLDSRLLSDFSQGKYIGWNVTGPVLFEIYSTEPLDAANGDNTQGLVVVNGIFVDPVANETINPIGWLKGS